MKLRVAIALAAITVGSMFASSPAKAQIGDPPPVGGVACRHVGASGTSVTTTYVSPWRGAYSAANRAPIAAPRWRGNLLAMIRQLASLR